jgi:hypothetical protein
MASNFIVSHEQTLVTIMSNTPKLFEDGVFCTDTSKFIDYPKVKIRSYEAAEDKKIRKIFFYTCVFSVLSGIAVLIV